MKRFLKRSLLLLGCSVLCLCSLAAQTRSISGTVTDARDATPLPGVSILVPATGQGTVTDGDGTFRLTVPGDTEALLVSFVGYRNVTVPLEAADQLAIQLEAGVALDEVVVTALGLRRPNRELGYAVQQLPAEAVQDVQAVNFLDNLTGQFAGVDITAGATGVGSTSRVSIRGESSFANNNPLFVVDGVPINNNSIINRTDEAAVGFQEIDFGNGAMEINPADVAEVSVLKGPGAAALYGTRAANGVILIETKDGSDQRGRGISFSTSLFRETPFQLPRYQNTYGQGNNGEFAYVDGLGGGINDNITYSYGPRLDAGLLIPQFDSPVPLPDGRVVRGGDINVHGGAPITPTPFVARPDNVRNFYEAGLTRISNLAFDGGDERGNYRLSLTDLDSDSYIPGVNLRRRTAAVRVGFRPTDRLSVRASLNYVHSASDNRPSGGYGSENINYDLTAWLGRQTDLAALRDYWQPGLENVQQYSYNYTFFDNPYFILLENRNAFQRDRVFGYLSARYDFTEELSLTVRSGMDLSDEERQFRRAFSTNRFKNGGYAEQGVFFREINSDFLLNYAPRLAGAWSLEVSFGGNRLDQRAVNDQQQALTLAQPGVFQLSNAASPVEVFHQEADKRINSLYGLARIGYSDWLFLDLTGRNDWSSALATPTNADNTSFFYPSASLSILPSAVLDLPDAVSFAQLRASWAQVGNDTDPYRTAGTFVAQTPFNGRPTFSDQLTLPQPNLLPEQTTAVEVGADLRLLDDRISLDLALYRQRTENQILLLPIALSSGYNQQVVNGGTVVSRGLEASIGLWPVRSRNVSWEARLNFTTNRAEVISLPQGAERLTIAYSRVYDNPNQTVYFIVEEGGQIGDMWGTGYLRNTAGQFVVGEDGRFIADNNLRKLGNYNPDFMLGWSNQVRVGHFDFGLLLDWRQGGELVSRTLSLAGVAGQLEETEDRPEAGIVADAVVNVGTAAQPEYRPNTMAIPAETYYRQFYDRNHEENNVYDASYLKVRELNIGYTLSQEHLANGPLRGLHTLRIALVGRNLYAFSAIPHFDPEQLALQGQTFVRGVEDMSYPTARSIGFKLSLGL
jgi:TonB-linked SusC/RagA family outer membrane protein